jgi:hypothetical protein
VWGSDWDGLFARDTTGALARAFANTVDGQMQTFAAKDGRFNRDTFFGQNEELQRLAQGRRYSACSSINVSCRFHLLRSSDNAKVPLETICQRYEGNPAALNSLYLH